MYAAVILVCLQLGNNNMDCKTRIIPFRYEHECLEYVEKAKQQAVPEHFKVDIKCTPFNQRVSNNENI